MRILIVDDAPEMVQLIAAILTPVSSFVTSSDSLQGCLDSCEVHVFDVILLDLTLTDSVAENTADSIYKIRALQPDSSIIAISGNPDVESMRKKCLENGADMYLPKQEMISKSGHAVYAAVAAAVLRKTKARRTPTYESNVRMLCNLAHQTI